MSVEKEVKKLMEESLDHFKKELKGLRTSRANPAVLEQIPVDLYGATMRVRDAAQVTVSEARKMIISPFDPQNIGPIAKAIEIANIGLQGVVDGHVIRVTVPPMDESIRKETVKTCKKKSEEAKVAVREIRRKCNEKVRKMKSEGLLSEDQVKREEKMIQEKTDAYCKQIDELVVVKEKEILEI